MTPDKSSSSAAALLGGWAFAAMILGIVGMIDPRALHHLGAVAATAGGASGFGFALAWRCFR